MESKDWKATVMSLAQKAGYETGREAYKEEMLHEEFDPQAELFGWFLDHGWTPPAELPVKLEEAKKAGIREVVEWVETKGKPFYGDKLMIVEIPYEKMREFKEKAGINEIV